MTDNNTTDSTKTFVTLGRLLREYDNKHDALDFLINRPQEWGSASNKGGVIKLS